LTDSRPPPKAAHTCRRPPVRNLDVSAASVVPDVNDVHAHATHKARPPDPLHRPRTALPIAARRRSRIMRDRAAWSAGPGLTAQARKRMSLGRAVIQGLPAPGRDARVVTRELPARVGSA